MRVGWVPHSPKLLSRIYSHALYHYVCPFTLFPITLTARPPCHSRAVVVILPLLSCRLGFHSYRLVYCDGCDAQYSTVTPNAKLRNN
jgi:hypothetical protein